MHNCEEMCTTSLLCAAATLALDITLTCSEPTLAVSVWEEVQRAGTLKYLVRRTRDIILNSHIQNTLPSGKGKKHVHFYFEIYMATETWTVRYVLAMQQTCNVTSGRKNLECANEATFASVTVVGRLHQIESCPERRRGTPDYDLCTKYTTHVEISGSALPQITSETLENIPESCNLYQEARSGIPHKPSQTQIQSFIYEDRPTNTPVCPLTLLTYSDSKMGRWSPCRIKKDLTIRWGDKPRKQVKNAAKKIHCKTGEKKNAKLAKGEFLFTAIKYFSLALVKIKCHGMNVRLQTWSPLGRFEQIQYK